jgi:glutamate-ammonia-ligase adenylyltransferase
MSFKDRITRTPIPFDAARGEEVSREFPQVASQVRELLAGAGGSSPYLAGLLTQEPTWLDEALENPEEALKAVLSTLPAVPFDQLKSELRIAKRRVALLVALADLGGVWPLEQVTAALTDLADTALAAGLRGFLTPEILRNKLPGMTEDDLETAAGMVVLAMGKMGAHELNYSSDIDLICLFDESRFDRDDFMEARTAFIRVTRRLAALMSEPTGDGYVFRTDLRLRPDPSVTPVCIAMEAAERYYESLGRTWERAAHIKARPSAGDFAAGDAYLERLRPFIWRKHLDFAAIQDAHDMRLRIREHKGLGGALTLEGHDMKLGKGGIREIEFFTQTRQIIAGGRDPDLRLRGTVPSLAALAQKGWIPEDVADELTDHYRMHREVEHRLQMVADAQTHSLPKDDDGFRRLACLMGEADVEAMRRSIAQRLERTAELTEGFFAPGSDTPTDGVPELSESAQAVVARWPSYAAFRSSRAMDIFKRLQPEIMKRFCRAAKPDEALMQFDGFLSGLPAGVQLFSLFEANPQLIDLIVDICATSPSLAMYLSRNSGVFDAVIGGGFFDPWPGMDALLADLREDLEAVTGDYEGQLDTTRRWQKEWRFRVGVHHLRGLIGAEEAAGQYTDLADVILHALFPVVVADIARRHGSPPGRGAMLLGMGSLGAVALNAKSDLDLIVIYDADGTAASEGKRPLMATAYYAKLTKALVTALTAQMSQGMLYETDMRLRPSGRQGPVATSWSSFQSYQDQEAWTWEHLALTRARPVAVTGPEAGTLVQDVEDFRQELLKQKGERQKTLQDVSEMRARLAESKPGDNEWDVKKGPGRLQDIELIGQAGALLAHSPTRRPARQIAAARRAGLLSEEDAKTLRAHHSLLRIVQQSTRLMTDQALDPEAIGEGGRAFLLEQTGYRSMGELLSALTEGSDRCAKLIDGLLADVAA